MNAAATTVRKPLTARQIFEQFNVELSPQQLGAMRRQQRKVKGPPFRYVLEYAPAVLTAEEAADALAQAEDDEEAYIGGIVDPLALAEADDETEIVGAQEGTYSVLSAQTLEDAKDEAERLWSDEPHEGAIGYAICSSDWSCRHVYTVPLDNVVMLGNVRPR